MAMMVPHPPCLPSIRTTMLPSRGVFNVDSTLHPCGSHLWQVLSMPTDRRRRGSNGPRAGGVGRSQDQSNDDNSNGSCCPKPPSLSPHLRDPSRHPVITCRHNGGEYNGALHVWDVGGSCSGGGS